MPITPSFTLSLTLIEEFADGSQRQSERRSEGLPWRRPASSTPSFTLSLTPIECSTTVVNDKVSDEVKDNKTGSLKAALQVASALFVCGAVLRALSRES